VQIVGKPLNDSSHEWRLGASTRDYAAHDPSCQAVMRAWKVFGRIFASEKFKNPYSAESAAYDTDKSANFCTLSD